MVNDDAITAMKERKLRILEQKNEERKLKMEKRKELKLKTTVQEENVNNILSQFEALEKEIQSYLKQLESKNTPKESLPDIFDSCFCKLEEWSKLVSSTSHILTIYHKKLFQERYHILNDKKLQLEQSLLPQKKFSFKRALKKTEIRNKKVDNKLSNDTPDAVMEKPTRTYFKIEDEHGFSKRENENLMLRHEEVSQKDLLFRELKHCKLNIEGGSATIHFLELTNCHILCGPVSTSAFVEKCYGCTFSLACQQLRIHTTYDSDFYVHVTSRAIIEDSQRVRFAPYNWKYENVERHFKLVKLDIEKNNWNLVDDFNWLSSAPSPNWSVINEQDRVTV